MIAFFTFLSFFHCLLQWLGSWKFMSIIKLVTVWKKNHLCCHYYSFSSIFDKKCLLICWSLSLVMNVPHRGWDLQDWKIRLGARKYRVWTLINIGLLCLFFCLSMRLKMVQCEAIHEIKYWYPTYLLKLIKHKLPKYSNMVCLALKWPFIGQFDNHIGWDQYWYQ